MAALVDHATEHLLTVQVSGHCLHGAVYLPFGELDKPADWLDPSPFKSIKLKLTGASGVAPTTLVLQQLRI